MNDYSATAATTLKAMANTFTLCERALLGLVVGEGDGVVVA